MAEELGEVGTSLTSSSGCALDSPALSNKQAFF